MGKKFRFQCNKCKLNLLLRKGVGKNSPSPLNNFYCAKCENISYQITCQDCSNELSIKLLIPQKRVSLFTSSHKNLKQPKLVCPRCESDNTEIIFISEWD